MPLFQVKKKAIEKRKADESFSKEFAAMEAVSTRFLWFHSILKMHAYQVTK